MVAFGSVRKLGFLAVVLFLGCAKKEEPKVAAPAVAEVEAAPQAALLEAAPVGATEEPEPEVHPCRHCTVDVSGRIGGTWQPATCLPGSTGGVVYPVGAPSVEVLSGNQKGQEFLVTASPQSFALGENFSGTLPATADVKTWEEARLWVKGAGGTRCASLLSIQR